MGRGGYRVEDAKGRATTLIDPVALHLLRPLMSGLLNRPDVIPGPQLREIAKEADEGWGKRGHLIVLVYVFGLAVTVACAAYVKWRYGSGVGGLIFYALATVWCAGAFFITWFLGKRARCERTCLVMLKHRRCPHCAYDLRELPIDSNDGTTVCPECGCVWRLDEPAAVERLAADDRARAALRVKNRKRLALMVLLLVLGVVLAVVQWVRYTAAKKQAVVLRGAAALVQPAGAVRSVGGAGQRGVESP